ncbi:hypothetical protein V1264_021168 [Littorina saxatilis]|uniref:PiggyBac transposable element-derived protein domain-containing protein n=1 Tax=Littorina saxatilis TaxID=31220 RepID=A0AAN9GBN1_9CAEN
MERPNIFDALVTVEGYPEELYEEPVETIQAVEGAAADVPDSGDDETSDEEFLPPSSDDESPDEVSTEEELEGDEEECSPSELEDLITYTTKDGTKWRKAPVLPSTKTKSKNIFKPPPTQIPGTHHVHKPYDSFKLFVSDKMITDTVRYTNMFGSSKWPNMWVACDSVEIEALFGLMLFLGVRKQNMLSTSEVWDPIDGISLVRACMSINRFKTLMSCLRFDDKSTRSARRGKDTFAPFRDMWDQFNNNLSKHYIAGPLLTIDEQLVPFRGRCNFLQYLPSKPDRYGIKIFWIADSSNCFPLFGIPYLGRPIGQDRQVNLGRNTALQLAQPFFKSGHNVTCDNYFTDFSLAEGCLKNGLTVVGTVRTNKRFLPEPFKSKKGLPLHGNEFAYGTTATLVNYQGKRNKNTVVLSSMHEKGVVEAGAPKNKPEIILFYNSTKGAVDALDKMAHTYTSKRVTNVKSRKGQAG